MENYESFDTQYNFFTSKIELGGKLWYYNEIYFMELGKPRENRLMFNRCCYTIKCRKRSAIFIGCKKNIQNKE